MKSSRRGQLVKHLSEEELEQAIVATARKLLVSMYYMLDREEVYDPPGAFVFS